MTLEQDLRTVLSGRAQRLCKPGCWIVRRNEDGTATVEALAGFGETQ